MVDEHTDRHELATLMGRFFSAVSFGPGARPGYGSLPELFVDGAVLIKNSEPVPEISRLGDFVAVREATVDAGRLTSFEEIEVAAVTELFGNVAHRFSTYEKRGTTDGAPIEARGAISTQMIRTPGGWRISAMAWDDERPGVEVPSRYLSPGSS